jgi:hypothetical protein
MHIGKWSTSSAAQHRVLNLCLTGKIVLLVVRLEAEAALSHLKYRRIPTLSSAYLKLKQKMFFVLLSVMRFACRVSSNAYAVE